MTIDRERGARNREALQRFQLDALICRLPENVLLLTSYWPLSSSVFVLYPRESSPVLIVPHTEQPQLPADIGGDVRSFVAGVIGAPDPYLTIEGLLRDAAREAGVTEGRIGVETGVETVAAGHTGGEMLIPGAATRSAIEGALPDATIVDGSDALDHARAIKTSREIEKLRRANEVAAFGLEAFRSHYVPGRTEADVASAVEAEIVRRGIGYEGVQHARAWAQLMTGPSSAWAYSMHPATSDRVIERGDLGVLELGTSVGGYWSDLTRTLVAGGGPDARQIELYDAVIAAVDAVLEKASAGLMGGTVDALARKEIHRRGLGEFFIHHTGHGLGFRYHEPIPRLFPDDQGLVKAGMVSSVEPGLYVTGFSGMRLEENVVFTETGVELLSIFDRSLA
jgi:Xaa-Pro dipeptidase